MFTEFLDCYLEVMVLMPKGRKCITFIGHSILESKREKIWKYLCFIS